MTEFNIEAGVLKEVLTLVQAAGKTVKGDNKPLLSDCILHAKNDSLIINAIDENEILITMIKIKMEKKDIVESGKVPITLEECIEVLKRYKSKDKINIVCDESITFLRKSPKLKIVIPTVSEDSIKSQISMKDFPFKHSKGIWHTKTMKFDTSVTLDSNQFSEVVKDGEQIQYRTFPFTVNKNKLTVTVEDVESGRRIERELDSKEIKAKKNIASLFSYGFGNAFGNLIGEITIHLCNEAPMIIEKKTDNYDLTYILASTVLEDSEIEDENENEDIDETLDDYISEEIEGKDNEEEIDYEELEEIDEDIIEEDKENEQAERKSKRKSKK